MKIFFALTSLVLFLAVNATAGTTNTLSDAEIQGRQLAQQLCEAIPEGNFTNTGILQIRSSNGSRTNLTFNGQVTVAKSNWQSFYYVPLKSESGIPDSISLVINSSHNQSHEYLYTPAGACIPAILKSSETMIPFANSDFWLCDLGLEFFHWPAQKVLKKEIKRSRGCTVLESTNPNPATNGYSRVVSWIDSESGGIVQAQAYDFNGKLLKEFAPKSFKKVNGQWELQEMQINNVQTGSRTRLDFDLKAK